MRKMGITFLLSISFILYSSSLWSQDDFTFMGKDEDKESIDFRLVNNLIVFPLEINNKKLQFILDTGVNKSILFSIHDTDSLDLNNVNTVLLKGLGSGEAVTAIRSQNNTFKINDLISRGEELYVVTEDRFSLSSKMGLTIHGIIGYNLIKDVVLEINYSRKKLIFHNPKTFKYRKCRKCESYSLFMHNNKPYIDAKVDLNRNIKNKDVKLLIDSGGSDALWLFEDDKENISVPEKHFDDILGEGLSGVILGKRSRIEGIAIGKHYFKKPTVSFLDSVSHASAKNFKERNGSIGGNILRRFNVWIDYNNQKITLKKNGYYKRPFEYNMSGMTVGYYGKELVKVEDKKSDGIVVFSRNSNEMNKGNTISFVKNYKYVFKPIYEVLNVVSNSPAGKAGVLPGDLLFMINSKNAYEYDLKDINNLLQKRPNQKINLVVKRNGIKIKLKFSLKRTI